MAFSFGIAAAAVQSCRPGVAASSSAAPAARQSPVSLQRQRREFAGCSVRSSFEATPLRRSIASPSAAPLIAASASANNLPPTYTGVSRFQDNDNVKLYNVTIKDPKTGETNTVQVPSNQYILRVAEGQDVFPPYACRNGCCTTCAVRVKKGDLIQPEAMGLSRELRQQGYALLCVSYPRSDLEVELQDEDEVYMLQFGQYFAKGKIEGSGILLEDD